MLRNEVHSWSDQIHRHKGLKRFYETGAVAGIQASHARRLRLQLAALDSAQARVLRGTSRVTLEMALRLSKALGRSPESWLAMQDAYDLWQARQSVDLRGVAKLKFAVAAG